MLLLVGCAAQRTTTIVDRDSISRNSERRDSVYLSTWRHDSVYQRDSVYIYQRGDTLIQYVAKTLNRWRTRTDTVYTDKLKTDTLYIERVDNISTAPAVTADPIKWYDRGFIWFGRLCLLALLIWIIFLYLKRKL